MWDKPYITSDEYEYDAEVRCMRCDIKVLTRDYVEMPKKKSPNEKVNVLAKKKLANYRLMPVIYLIDEKEVNGHLVVCSACYTADISEEDSKNITKILQADYKENLKWHGYQIKEKDPRKDIQFLRRA